MHANDEYVTPGPITAAAPGPPAVFDAPADAPAPDAPDEDKAYEDMDVDELKAELKSRDLPVSGNKPELIERLEKADEG